MEEGLFGSGVETMRVERARAREQNLPLEKQEMRQQFGCAEDGLYFAGKELHQVLMRLEQIYVATVDKAGLIRDKKNVVRASMDLAAADGAALCLASECVGNMNGPKWAEVLLCRLVQMWYKIRTKDVLPHLRAIASSKR